VAAGAFGAHALAERLSADLLEVFQTGVRYHLVHALALLVVGLAVDLRPHRLWDVAGWLFSAGIVIFGGSLYALALSGVRWLGAITPIGGLCFLAGWASVALAALRSRPGA
jgi:uncharacterized membrane protein YgdD (TMEM256/DUF423 family)